MGVGWGGVGEGGRGAHLRKWPCTVMSRPQAVTCKSPIMCIIHRRGFRRQPFVCLHWVRPNLISTCPWSSDVSFFHCPKHWIHWGEEVQHGLWHLLFNTGSAHTNQQGEKWPQSGSLFSVRTNPTIVHLKFSFSICIIVPVRKCLSLNFWFGLEPQSLIWCPSCSPIVHPSFPTMAARKAIFGRFNGRKWAPRYTRGTESVCRQEVLLYW